MFAKLKKKIEEEVGDLGQLTTQVTNTFSGGDRRVSSGGGSSQGTNTPNNLGSRQSSMASLVDLHPIDENQPMVTTPTSKNPPNFAHHLTPLSPQSPVTPNSGPPTARSTSNYIASVQQKAMENYEAELKKVNNEWSKKLDAQKKTFEEKLQNQEADFAWKYSTKEDEIEKLRVDKRKLEETVKNVEGIYQSKITRAHDDIDQLEGYTKQEMAKVKHLLLNAQADLQQAQGELFQSEIKVKDLSEENQNLKSENDNLLKNLNKLEFGTGKTVKTLEVQLEELRNKTASLCKELEVEKSKYDQLKADHDKVLKELGEEKSNFEALKASNEAQLEKLNTQNATYEADSIAYIAELKELREKLVQCSADAKSRDEHGDELKFALDEKQLEELRNKTASLCKELEVEKSKYGQLKADHDKVLNEFGEEKSNLEALKASNEAQLGKLNDQIATYEVDSIAYTAELKELREKLVQCSADAKSRDEYEDELKLALDEKQKQLEELRNKTTSLCKELEVEKSRYGQLKADLADHDKVLKEFDEEKSNFEALKASNEAQLQKLNTQIATYEVDSIAYIAELKELREKLVQCSADAKSRDECEDELKRALGEKQLELEELRNKTVSLKELEVEKSKYGQLKADYDKVLKEFGEEKSNFEALKASNDCNEAQLGKLNTQNATYEADSIAYIAELKELREKLVQCSANAKSRDEYEDELKLALDEIDKLNNENDSLQKSLSDQKMKFDAEVKANTFELNVLREKLLMLESEAQTKEENDGKLGDVAEELHRLKAENDMLSKSLREEKVKFRKQMKDHTSAINELKGKMKEEPAVIQSSNSHHTEASNNYTEDVNFQYMRSVLFKFITTSDPQVTKHLTKAVATLLHLNDEEGRLLQRSTDKRIKSWFPGGGEHLS